MKPTDLCIRDVTYSFSDYLYRTPIKFGGVPVDRVTLLDVAITVETRAGLVATGHGSMPLGNVWSFPSRKLHYDQTLAAMKALANDLARLTATCRESGHPLDLTHLLEPLYHQAASAQSANLAEPIPPLCTLVVASPFDAALHDAMGKAHGLSCWHTYGCDFVSHDLGHYLGPEFAGEDLARYVLREPVPSLPLYHLVGALDPLTAGDVTHPVGDGLPETLAEWIDSNGLTHLKIKLNGDDLAWDVERVLRVDAVAEQARPGGRWSYSLDFNERCPDVSALLEFLHRLREKGQRAYERVAYIEQPTARDLKAHRHQTMHAASALRPVVIDESLLDLESLQLAREMGYTGAALKACKGQSQSLLMAAAAQKYGMFLCVQDLTCPGASLIHSASLAAHIPGVQAIEANARQYVPAANAGWEHRFPGVFTIRTGVMDTSCLNGVGLGTGQ
ncbi:MAG: enolase C-terminal domain-like protein [Gemmataceae bacterium]